MKKEFSNFLFNFTTDEDYSIDFEVTNEHQPLINKILKELTYEEYETFVKQLDDRWFLGFEFFDRCIDFVVEENKEKFLELVWDMFFDQMDSSKTEGWHPWLGQFNPLDGLETEDDFESRNARWFREGAIRYEIAEDDILGSAYLILYPSWWINFEHFLEEVCEFRSKDFLINLLTELSKRLKKDEQPSLPSDKGKKELLEIFKTWAGSDLSYFDGDEQDWFSNVPFFETEESS